jgi:hypothetical protein
LELTIPETIVRQHFVTVKASDKLKCCTVDVEGSNALQLSATAVLVMALNIAVLIAGQREGKRARANRIIREGQQIK